MHNQVEKFIQNDGEIHLQLTKPLTAGVPAGTVITDSDNRSFVYLFDTGEQYTYVHFKQNMWDALKEVLKNKVTLKVTIDDQIVELPNVEEELTMLLDNIYGNSNYGEAFTKEVENEFGFYFQQ